jgi:hypothetical protein
MLLSVYVSLSSSFYCLIFVFSNLIFSWVQELTGHHLQYVFNTFHDDMFISAVVSKIMILRIISNIQFVIIYLV